MSVVYGYRRKSRTTNTNDPLAEFRRPVVSRFDTSAEIVSKLDELQRKAKRHFEHFSDELSNRLVIRYAGEPGDPGALCRESVKVRGDGKELWPKQLPWPEIQRWRFLEDLHRTFETAGRDSVLRTVACHLARTQAVKDWEEQRAALEGHVAGCKFLSAGAIGKSIRSNIASFLQPTPAEWHRDIAVAALGRHDVLLEEKGSKPSKKTIAQKAVVVEREKGVKAAKKAAKKATGFAALGQAWEIYSTAEDELAKARQNLKVTDRVDWSGLALDGRTAMLRRASNGDTNLILPTGRYQQRRQWGGGVDEEMQLILESPLRSRLQVVGGSIEEDLYLDEPVRVGQYDRWVSWTDLYIALIWTDWDRRRNGAEEICGRCRAFFGESRGCGSELDEGIPGCPRCVEEDRNDFCVGNDEYEASDGDGGWC